ncbi:hypothetical protein ACJX0J_016065, partial [Zea mays]
MRFPLDVGQPVQGNKDISNSAVTTNYLPYYDIDIPETTSEQTCLPYNSWIAFTVFGIRSFYSASNWVSYKAFLENAFSKQAWRQTFYFTQSGRTHLDILILNINKYLIVSADNA